MKILKIIKKLVSAAQSFSVLAWVGCSFAITLKGLLVNASLDDKLSGVLTITAIFVMLEAFLFICKYALNEIR